MKQTIVIRERTKSPQSFLGLFGTFFSFDIDDILNSPIKKLSGYLVLLFKSHYLNPIGVRGFSSNSLLLANSVNA